MIDEKLKYDEGLLDSYQGKWMNLYFLKTNYFAVYFSESLNIYLYLCFVATHLLYLLSASINLAGMSVLYLN